jgi:hypothetical protein
MRHLLSAVAWVSMSVAAAAAESAPEPTHIERFVAIDNVCAWPNLTVLPNGTLVATIFNQPSHGLQSGDVECWGSSDGRFWKRLGTPAIHEPETIRMNVAAGLARNGDLVVLCSGWTNQQQPGQPKKDPFRDAILKVWVCRSADGGRTWQVGKQFPDNPTSDMQELIPFGNIFVAEDGSLRASCYASHRTDHTHKTWMVRSDDDGKSWSVMSLVSDHSNETFLFPLGEKKWLAAARGREIELFRSNDDGRNWTNQGPVTRRNEINGHLLRLKDGRLLLTYGSRIKGEFGVLARFSPDDGVTWGAPQRIYRGLSWDCGYPSSAQLPDGQIVTAYYSKSSEGHNRYHMGVALWGADGSASTTSASQGAGN